MTGCQEPRCEEYAVMVISHDIHRYPFCTEHVWPRVHRWLNKLPMGERVCVETIEPEAKQALQQGRVLRSVRKDYGAGVVVVPGSPYLESTEGSPKGTNQTVTPGEVPAMRKPTRQKRK